MTAATMKISRTGPAARASAQSARTQQRQHDELHPARDDHRLGRARRAAVAASAGGSCGSVVSARSLAHRPSAPEYAPCRRRPRPSCSSATSSAASAGARCSALLPRLRERARPDFVVVNGENAAGGLGITPQIADELFAAGVDVITLGNHAYHRREIYPLPRRRTSAILRPANYLRLPARPRRVRRRARRRAARRGQPLGQRLPARRARTRSRRSTPIARRPARPLRPRARRLPRRGDEREGRAWAGTSTAASTAVVGTHTHVPTADARVLPGRDRLHHRRRDDRPARRRDRRRQGAGDRVAAHAHVACASRPPRTTRGSWASLIRCSPDRGGLRRSSSCWCRGGAAAG